MCDPVAGQVPGTRAFFGSIEGIRAQVAPQCRVRDTDGTYANWFTSAAVDVVLQPPDCYLFGTAPRVDAVSELVAQLRRELSGHIK